LKWELEDSRAISEFVSSYYGEDAFIPEEIHLPLEIDDTTALSEILSDLKGKKVSLLRPVRGLKREMVELASKNAAAAIHERDEKKASLNTTLLELQNRLNLERLPQRIECYDISTIQGRFSVGSGVVFTDGKADKKLYRHYRIRQVSGQDDFAMLSEVFSRRFRADNLESYGMPDLVVVDGGIGQLNTALEIIRGLGMEERFDLVSLAKSRVAPDAASDTIQKSNERVFLPGRRNPVILRQNSPQLLLLAAIRNEAHRFAIEYHRKLRSKEGVASALDQIPGIAAKRRITLLKHFGSLQGLKGAGLEEIMSVEGISRTIAENIYSALHTQETDIE
jgi:excinuclease ABC subunit C